MPCFFLFSCFFNLLVVVEGSQGRREIIRTTEEHPFWVNDEGWVAAFELKEGDELVNPDDDIIRVISQEKEEGTETVYNVEVEDFHTYFVGDLNIFVHNANCGFATVTGEMRRSFRGQQMLDPFTNEMRSLKTFERMSVDHIYPVSRITDLRGYDKLTRSQRIALVRDEVGLGNLQVLTTRLNSSKGANLNWRRVGVLFKELNTEYADNLQAEQLYLRSKMQDHIDKLIGN